MNIYKLKSDEVHNLHNEFNKTDFGRRAKAFAMMPLVGAIVCFLLFVIEDILKDGSYLFLGLTFLNMSLLGISQLQYGNMLKDYAQSKKDKE